MLVAELKFTLIISTYYGESVGVGLYECTKLLGLMTIVSISRRAIMQMKLSCN